MSQNLVYETLLSFDGPVSTAELKQRLQEEYPDRSIYRYCTNRLRKLEEKGVIEIDESTTPFVVRVVDREWEGVPDAISHDTFPPTGNE